MLICRGMRNDDENLPLVIPSADQFKCKLSRTIQNAMLLLFSNVMLSNADPAYRTVRLWRVTVLPWVFMNETINEM